MDAKSNTSPTVRLGVPTSAGNLYHIDGDNVHYSTTIAYDIRHHNIEFIIWLEYVINHKTGTAVVLDTDVDVILIAEKAAYTTASPSEPRGSRMQGEHAPFRGSG